MDIASYESAASSTYQYMWHLSIFAKSLLLPTERQVSLRFSIQFFTDMVTDLILRRTTLEQNGFVPAMGIFRARLAHLAFMIADSGANALNSFDR